MLEVISEAEYAVSDAEHWALVMVFTSTCADKIFRKGSYEMFLLSAGCLADCPLMRVFPSR